MVVLTVLLHATHTRILGYVVGTDSVASCNPYSNPEECICTDSGSWPAVEACHVYQWQLPSSVYMCLIQFKVGVNAAAGFDSSSSSQ